MKTQIYKKTSKISLLILFLFVLQLTTMADKPLRKHKNKPQVEENTSYFSIEGRIIDKDSKKPLVFANIYLVGKNIATITNLEGDFIIKVPNELRSGKLEFSFIGYKNKITSIKELSSTGNTISLESTAVSLDQVTIRPEEPASLIRGALQNIKENYSEEPAMLTGFYREAIKQNRNYVAVSEGILDIYKTPYTSISRNDLIKVFKGRKSTDVKKMDTVIFKLKGGPNTTLLLDIVKNPHILLSYEFMEYYKYELLGIVTVNDKQNYAIRFVQNKKSDYPLYNGRIYLDVDNLAITVVEFSLNLDNIFEASRMLVRKKPLNMKVTPLMASYFANYREVDNKWYLNYMRAEVKFKCNWKKKLFNSVYTTMSEMAITDRDMENITKFKYAETAKSHEVFTEKVGFFDNDNFWGKHNYIKPDESIETAIKRLSKKLKRRQ